MRWIVFLLLVLLAGCTAQTSTLPPTSQCKWPEIPSDTGCCRDLNENSICDTVEFAEQLEAERQKEYELAAQKARETAEKSGRYKPTIVNELYANATKVKSYRFIYKGDEILVANNTIVRRLVSEYPVGSQTINGRRMNVVVNTVYLDFTNRNAIAECIPPPNLVAAKQDTVCDKFIGYRFEVPFDTFAFKMPIKWLEEFLYRTPITTLPGSHIGKRTATLYKFTDLQDANRKTHIWVDEMTGMPLRVEVWQDGVLEETKDYLDFYVI
ncbi:MAG: hypothetical protein QXT19_05230 [Candidatus Woesearchaeota archaeon]